MTDSSSWRRFAARLGVEHSIIQAPMGGGITTPELVAEVSNAGALGSIGASYLPPEELIRQARAVRALTQRPFAINLFAPVSAETKVDPAPMLERLARYHQQLGLPAPQVTATALPDFFEQVEAVLESGPTLFSFTFGIPPARVLESFKSKGILVAGTATSVQEARQLEAAGVDFIVAQGAEAGGHRGTFAVPFEAGLVGTMALVPQVVDAVRLPVIASGGIMDGRGIVASRVLGASGVQLGTAFMTCREAGTAPAHKAALRSARDDATRITRAFTGRPGRMISNEFIEALAGSEAILPFPAQHYATVALRGAAAKQGETRFMALWAGQAASLTRDMSAAELVRALVAESEGAAASALRESHS
ncbi:NAD(P)H-dependent flavin oxidoreductase [Hyalangium gracile]|uniref:NAD(P)H-dependent flavin oxidoreductase n=1 Tax=Hyalangium gracile TaxID=394092 RepID=UPI001CCF14B2|nr:nitronate monooxygenase [Hyalangium gracile]